MDVIGSRFKKNIIFYLVIAGICSFLLSLFLLEVFFAALSIMWLLESIENKKRAFDVFTSLIIIFGLIRIVSIFFSQYPSVSYQSFYKDALFYLSFFSLSFYLKAVGKEKIRLILYWFLIAAVIISITGLFLFNLNLVERTQSFTAGYATFSSYLVAALGLFLVFHEENNERLRSIFIISGIALILTAIITSMGRTNIFISGVLFFAALFLRKFKLSFAFIIVLITILLSLFSFNNNRVEVTNRVDNPTDLSDRNVLLEGAKLLALSHPVLGFGPRTFHQIFPLKNKLADKGIGSWHNDFIQVYFESGVLGLFSFLLIIFSVYYYGIKLLRRNINNTDSKIILSTLFGFSGLVLSALTAGFIDSPILSILFAFFISIISAEIFYNKDLKAA